jgi:S-methylmethionine-dependent homocysteine/selenocysteine methylase
MMRYARLKERLAERETIILDGPTGTELQRRGASMDALHGADRQRSSTSGC